MRPDAAVLFGVILYLGVRAGKRVPRAELLELIWTDVADTARRHSLRQIVYRLKRAGLELDLDGDDLCLEPQRVGCDLGVMLGDEWPATVAIKDIPKPADILPFYQPGVTPAFAEWVDRLRSDAGAQIRRASLRHIGVARREGRWQDVEHLARICLATDVLNEEGTLALAEATAMGGSKAEALRILDGFLWEIGTRDESIRVPAKLLRRRISDQPSFRIPRAGDGPLIARTEELAWLNARLDQAGTGAACTAMLLGPPGIGKTAVARAFIAHAEMRGWRPITSRLQPSDIDRPMSVFAELLPTLLKSEGALGAAPESIAQLRRLIEHRTEEDILSGKSQEAEAIQARIRSSMQDLLSAVTHEGPLILLLEDLHWIDNQSLRLLAWIVEHAPELQVMWLMTARLESRIPELRAAFADERTPSRLIEPLDREAATLLFKSVTPTAFEADVEVVAQRAYSVTGGNPLFIREVAGHWVETGSAEALPTNLRALMRGRVSRLSPAAQRVLHCCAVLGRYATVTRVATVLEISTSELLACIEEIDGLGISGLGGEPGSLALHDLWQEELAASVRPAPRALLHLRCGQVMAAEAGNGEIASIATEAARHLVAAGNVQDALLLLEKSAVHHLANGFAGDAVRTSAIALAKATAEPEMSRLWWLHMQALCGAGDWAAILAEYHRGVAGVEPCHGAIGRHGPAELMCFEALWRAGSATEEALTRALACGDDSTASVDHRIAACLLAAQCAANVFDEAGLHRINDILDKLPTSSSTDPIPMLAARVILETEIGSFQRAIEIAELLVSHQRNAAAIQGLARALRFATYPLRGAGDRSRALSLAAEAFELAARHQIAEDAAQAGDVASTICIEIGDLGAAESWLGRAEAWAMKTSARYSRRSLSASRALILTMQGRHDDAIRLLSDLGLTTGAATHRERLTVLEIQCRAYAGLASEFELRSASDELAGRLALTRSSWRQDTYVEALVIGLDALGDVAGAAHWRGEYATKWRRDLGPLPAALQPIR